MKIVINHLTRMQKGYICAAGVNLNNNKHVRAVLPTGRLTCDNLSCHGGVFDIANVIDLKSFRPNPSKPHVEDCVFNSNQAVNEGCFPPDKFWQLLCSVCKSKLCDIFGCELHGIGTYSCGTDQGEGEISLGCLYCTDKPNLGIETRNTQPTIRMELYDGQFSLNLSVTDIRLYQSDHFTPDIDKVSEFAKLIENSTEIILSLGLTRSFSSSPKFAPVHWLQVNNIHIKDKPTFDSHRQTNSGIYNKNRRLR